MDKELIEQKEGSFMQTIERLSMVPEIDVGKIEKIMEMQERILDRNARQAYNAAMTEVQGKIPTIIREKYNEGTRSNYASYENILREAGPTITKSGFSMVFYESEGKAKDGCIRVGVDILHREGHKETRFADIPIDNSGARGTINKTLTHAVGSSFSYGRRYLFCLIFNIPTFDDDDGQSASVKYLNEAELKKIDDLIKALKVDKEKFMKFMKAESTDKILKRDFGKALTALEAKRNRSKEGEKK